jgi:uncharacterized membrane protein SirB2
MNSNTLISVHLVSVMIFLLIYLVKTILLFAKSPSLEKFTKMTKVPDMIVSTLFLVTGVWLFIQLGGIKVMHIVKLVLVFAAIPLGIVGFKKKKPTLALIMLLLVIGAYGIAEMSRNKPFIPASVTLVSENPGPLDAGHRVYSANCVFCHGTDGRKAYRNAKDLTASTLDPALVSQLIMEGSKGKMPAYKTLTPEELSSVTLYVQSLRGGTAAN